MEREMTSWRNEEGKMTMDWQVMEPAGAKNFSDIKQQNRGKTIGDRKAMQKIKRRRKFMMSSAATAVSSILRLSVAR